MIQIQIKQLLAVKQQQLGKKITLTEVSEKTGISRMTLYRAINFSDYGLTTDTLDKLCGFFQCDLGELVTYIPPSFGGKSCER